MKYWTQYSRKELLQIKNRNDFQSKKIYDFLLIVPSNCKHHSGYNQIAIIGFDGKEFEICAYPDDIIFPMIDTDGRYGVRMDCSHKHKVMRLWSSNYKFQIPCAVSSTEIVLVKK